MTESAAITSVLAFIWSDSLLVRLWMLVVPAADPWMIVASTEGTSIVTLRFTRRGSTAEGFELDIITMVLLGGVSINGGSGTLYGVLLSILIILNLRNGMSLANMTGHIQTGVVGILLILSVLIPNLVGTIRTRVNRQKMSHVREIA